MTIRILGLRFDLCIAPTSVYRGIRAMTPNRDRHTINTGVDIRPNACWGIHAWTPTWHQGRGPYVSIRMDRLHIYRGY